MFVVTIPAEHAKYFRQKVWNEWKGDVLTSWSEKDEHGVLRDKLEIAERENERLRNSFR